MRERPALQHVSRRQNGSAGRSDGVPAVAAPQETARPSRQRPRTHDLHSSLNGNPRCGRIVRPHAAAQRGHMRLPAGWRCCSPCRPAFPPRRGVSLLHAPWPPQRAYPPHFALCGSKGEEQPSSNMGPGGCCTVEIEFGFSARTKICTKLINVYNRFSQRRVNRHRHGGPRTVSLPPSHMLPGLHVQRWL